MENLFQLKHLFMETIKTKYRVISDGYRNYLQYEIKTTFLGYKVQSEWKYIPHMDSISEIIPSEDDYYINEYNYDNFDAFVQKYPSITDYLCEWEIKKKLFEQNLNKKHQQKTTIVKEY